MKQRDIDLLSSYLDGQLSSSDSARLESRLLTDPELRSVLRDLRSTRNLLRQLPMRKAPRNFTLTPKMVGKNPPLPRAYPAFRFTSVLATILLFISFGLNLLRPQLAAAPVGFGMGGGGAPDTFAAESAPATEAPAAAEEPAEAPPSVALAPMPTMTASTAEDATRAMETPVLKNGETTNGVGGGLEQQPPQSTQEEKQFALSTWQWLFAVVALLSAFIMVLMRQFSVNRWRRKS